MYTKFIFSSEGIMADMLTSMMLFKLLTRGGNLVNLRKGNYILQVQ
jgi:hypothetical protein